MAIIKKLIYAKLIWTFPRESKILIYDSSGIETIKRYLSPFDYSVLNTRDESINIICYILSIFSQEFWSGRITQAYQKIYIKKVSPKIVITFTDNDPNFYLIKNYVPNTITIFIQNGVRVISGDIFSHIKPSKKFHVDYMLVFGSAIGSKYNQFISGTPIAIGSIKNNIKKIRKYNKNNIVLFISQFREKLDERKYFLISSDGEQIEYDEFYEAETIVLKFLSDWCKNNNKILKICGSTNNRLNREFYFYDNLLQSYQWEFQPKIDILGSYDLVDQAEIVVFIDSTLGYESLARGKKTAAFTCRGSIIRDKGQNFGWPKDMPDDGPFWTNRRDFVRFKKIMDFLNTSNQEEWLRICRFNMNEIIQFDEDNITLVSLIKRLLN